ncbi:hypothetical protein H0H93_002319 [Arthromyces matolae]|nr:hypothetical protein H0H93_002319 [Arthromyces matolae]
MPTSARKSSLGAARRGQQKAHIPYRGDNPEVGKKTGIAVRHVERKSDGFEPFDELMEQADHRTPPKLKVTKKRKQSIPVPEEEPDEYGEMSMDIDSPRQYFANSRQPITPTPKRNASSSRSVARTSDVDFDRIPSPHSTRKSTGPGPSRLSTSFRADDVEDDDDDDDNEPDHGYGGDDYDEAPGGSDEQNISHAQSFKDMDMDVDDEEQREQSDEEEPEEEPQPTPKRDKGKGRATLSDVPEERESDVEDEIAMGLEDVAEERYSDDEQPEPDPSPRHKKKIKVLEDPPKPKQQRTTSRAKKENRPQRDGVRKSAREHYAPLEWWRGEKRVYGRQAHSNGLVLVPPIKEIIRIPKEIPEPLGGKRKRSRAKSKTVDDEIHYKVIPVTNPEHGWDDETNNYCLLLDYDTKTEVDRRIGYRAKDILMADPVGHNRWSFMKAFGDADFIAAGVLEIPPGGKKPTKQTKDNTYVFYVIEGAVNLKVHNSNRLFSTGAMFIVPRGNSYYIENACDRNVRLFFTQARKVVEDIPPSFAPPRRSSVGAGVSAGRSSSAGALQGETRAISAMPGPQRAKSTGVKGP